MDNTEHNDTKAPEKAVEVERDEYLAGWKRAIADYENLRKETAKEKDDYRKFAHEQFLLRMLPAIDQYEVAMRYAPSLDAIPEDGRRVFEAWVTGLEAVRTLWADAAADLGLQRVRNTGAYDPAMHEAVESIPDDSVPDGHIVRVVENGYVLNGKLIRPAKVAVSSGSHKNT